MQGSVSLSRPPPPTGIGHEVEAALSTQTRDLLELIKQRRQGAWQQQQQLDAKLRQQHLDAKRPHQIPRPASAAPLTPHATQTAVFLTEGAQTRPQSAVPKTAAATPASLLGRSRSVSHLPATGKRRSPHGSPRRGSGSPRRGSLTRQSTLATPQYRPAPEEMARDSKAERLRRAAETRSPSPTKPAPPPRLHYIPNPKVDRQSILHAYSRTSLLVKSGMLSRPALVSQAPSWWKPPPPVVAASYAFDGRHQRRSGRAERAMLAVRKEPDNEKKCI